MPALLGVTADQDWYYIQAAATLYRKIYHDLPRDNVPSVPRQVMVDFSSACVTGCASLDADKSAPGQLPREPILTNLSPLEGRTSTTV